MSLESFVRLATVRERLRPLRPQGRRNLPIQLKMPPRSARYSLIGTAFDYLLRFELQRRRTNVVARPWVAEGARTFPHIAVAHWDEAPSIDWVMNSLDQILRSAKKDHANYIADKRPSIEDRQCITRHAIRLARLDELCRIRKLAPDFDKPTEEDVAELLELLDLFPFEEIGSDSSIWLNPVFGEWSESVGGADADLIYGDHLLDLKVTKKSEIQTLYLDQLLGYFLLARKHKESTGEIPHIGQAGFYFARHGHIYMFSAAEWTANPEFERVEQWFFEYARQLRHPTATAAGGMGHDSCAE